VELAQARIAKAHLVRAAVQAEIYDPAGAVEAGYLDQVVPAAAVEGSAIAEARRLGQLPGSAYRHTKLALHQAMIDRVLAGLDDDMQRMTAPS
jgi:enoyl-CoA hydratase